MGDLLQLEEKTTCVPVFGQHHRSSTMQCCTSACFQQMSAVLWSMYTDPGRVKWGVFLCHFSGHGQSILTCVFGSSMVGLLFVFHFYSILLETMSNEFKNKHSRLIRMNKHWQHPATVSCKGVRHTYMLYINWALDGINN